MSVSFSLPNDEAIDFQNEVNCVAGGWAFGRRLKFTIQTGSASAAQCMEVHVVSSDYAPVELCSQKKKGQSHESLFFRPYHCDEHYEGVSSGFITFYCKGSHHKGQHANGCRAKGPSTVRLRFLLEFADEVVTEIFSEPFRLHARRPRKQLRTPVRYPLPKTQRRQQPIRHESEAEGDDETTDSEIPATPPQQLQPEPPQPEPIVIKQEPQQKKRPLPVMVPPIDQPTVKKPKLNNPYDFISIGTDCTQILNVNELSPQVLSFSEDGPTPSHQQKKKVVDEPRIANVPQERMTTRRSSRQNVDTVGPTKMIGGPNYFPPNSLALAPLPNPFDYQNASMDQIWQNDLFDRYYPPKEIESDVDEDTLMHHIETLLSSPPHVKKSEPRFCVIDEHAEHQVDNRIRYSSLSGDNNVVLGVYFGSTSHLHFHPEPPQAMETEDDGYLSFLD